MREAATICHAPCNRNAKRQPWARPAQPGPISKYVPSQPAGRSAAQARCTRQTSSDRHQTRIIAECPRLGGGVIIIIIMTKQPQVGLRCHVGPQFDPIETCAYSSRFILPNLVVYVKRYERTYREYKPNTSRRPFPCRVGDRYRGGEKNSINRIILSSLEGFDNFTNKIQWCSVLCQTCSLSSVFWFFFDCIRYTLCFRRVSLFSRYSTGYGATELL